MSRRAGLMIVAAASVAIPGIASAEPSDLVSRPLVLDEHQVAADLVLETSLEPGLVGSPTSLAPDVWFGITRALTIGLVQSDPSLDRIPFFFEPGTSICVNRDAILCPHAYHGSAVDVIDALVVGHFAVAAHVRAMIRDIDPVKPAATVGAALRWQSGRWAISADPYLQIGLAHTEQGNRAELWVPVVFAVQPTCGWVVELYTGYDADLVVWRDGYHVPAEVAVRARASAHFDVGAAFGFSSILGPQNTPKERVLIFDVAWRS